MYKPDYSPNTFFHWHQIPVRFRDIDALNHLNNAVFNTFYEEARIHFILSIPEFSNSFEDGKSFVLIKSTIEYLKPILYPSTILVGTSCLSVGNTSVEAMQALYNAETKALHSVAVTKGVWFDVHRNRPARVPDVQHLEAMIFKPNLNG